MTDVVALPPDQHLDSDEAIIRRHQRGVWRFLRWLGADPALADDLLQEAFLLLLQRPPVDRREQAIAAWLRTTAATATRRRWRCACRACPSGRGRRSICATGTASRSRHWRDHSVCAPVA